MAMIHSYVPRIEVGDYELIGPKQVIDLLKTSLFDEN